MRIDSEHSAVRTIDRRSGEAVTYSTFDEKLFTMEAFDEALELTDGLPYSARGNSQRVRVSEREAFYEVV